MTLFNQHWTSFNGEPITGKTPPQTIVHAPAGVVMNALQQGGVAHAYKLFCDAVRISAIPDGYHVQHRTLRDGSTVKMTSINGEHRVNVWPAGGTRSKRKGRVAVLITVADSVRTEVVGDSLPPYAPPDDGDVVGSGAWPGWEDERSNDGKWGDWPRNRPVAITTSISTTTVTTTVKQIAVCRGYDSLENEYVLTEAVVATSTLYLEDVIYQHPNPGVHPVRYYIYMTNYQEMLEMTMAGTKLTSVLPIAGHWAQSWSEFFPHQLPLSGVNTYGLPQPTITMKTAVKYKGFTREETGVAKLYGAGVDSFVGAPLTYLPGTLAFRKDNSPTRNDYGATVFYEQYLSFYKGPVGTYTPSGVSLPNFGPPSALPGQWSFNPAHDLSARPIGTTAYTRDEIGGNNQGFDFVGGDWSQPGVFDRRLNKINNRLETPLTSKVVAYYLYPNVVIASVSADALSLKILGKHDLQKLVGRSPTGNSVSPFVSAILDALANPTLSSPGKTRTVTVELIPSPEDLFDHDVVWA